MNRNSLLAAVAGAALLLVFVGNAPAATPPATQQSAPLPEAGHSTIGYQTVAEALAALRSDPNYTVYTQQGWTLARDKSGLVTWSFPPATDPAYPAAVKRTIYKTNKAWNVSMQILCESTKAACDHLVRQFEELNKQMSEYLREQGQKKSQTRSPAAGSGDLDLGPSL